MKKVLLIAGLFVCLFLTTIFAQQNVDKSSTSRDDEIIQKLDQVLKNQAEMMESLKFIKNRSR